MPQATKIPDAKAAVDKEWKKLDTIPAWDLGNVKSEKAVSLSWCYRSTKEGWCSVSDILKDDSGAYAVFIEQGSSASQRTAAKIMDVIAKLPGCDGQAADAISAYTQVKMEDVQKPLEIPKSECPDVWIRLPKLEWPKSWEHIEDSFCSSWAKLVRTPAGRTLVGKTIWKVLIEIGWAKVPNGLFLSVYVDDIIGWKEAEFSSYMKNWWRTLTKWNQHHFFITFI